MTWNVLPLLRLGEVAGVDAPLGTEVNATLCIAMESWSIQVMVEPDETVMLAGEKFCPDPAPCGMVIVVPEPPEVADPLLPVEEPEPT